MTSSGGVRPDTVGYLATRWALACAACFCFFLLAAQAVAAESKPRQAFGPLAATRYQHFASLHNGRAQN